jgi:D-alanyl-D-alanine dipeptidase
MKNLMIQTVSCESVATDRRFRHLSTLPQICIDLRYASTNNFAGRDLYSPLDCAYLHTDAAAALAASAAWLAREHPTLRLLVLDALRPQRVQEALWRKLAGTGLEIYLANPEAGSIHSFGMAVDLTLIDTDGNALDMGTAFDDLTPRAHPALEGEHLRDGTLSAEHLANRTVLREAMQAGNWRGIATEWWHFDCGDRTEVRRTYARVL